MPGIDPEIATHRLVRDLAGEVGGGETLGTDLSGHFHETEKVIVHLINDTGVDPPDAELLAFTAKALRIYCGALFIFGIQIACQMTFVSIGNAPCSIIVAILRKFVLLIPLIFILPHILPDRTMAVYTAEPGA